MTTSNQIVPGMILLIQEKMYRVESVVRVTVPKGTPFIKTKLKELDSGQVIEKNFKLNQAVSEVTLMERRLEFLYTEGQDYLFLDISNLDQVLVPRDVVGKQAHFLKEGTEVKASLYGSNVFSIELPQFLEIMVTKVEEGRAKGAEGMLRCVVLETGGRLDAPLFIEAGDVIRVDTRTEKFVQRV